MEFLENKYLLITITFSIFALAKWMQKKTGWVLLNPILLTMAVLITFLKLTGISYETYSEGSQLIEFFCIGICIYAAGLCNKVYGAIYSNELLKC